jgi:hypothetical protein
VRSPHFMPSDKNIDYEFPFSPFVTASKPLLNKIAALVTSRSTRASSQATRRSGSQLHKNQQEVAMTSEEELVRMIIDRTIKLT